jgi:hypothetical protein
VRLEIFAGLLLSVSAWAEAPVSTPLPTAPPGEAAPSLDLSYKKAYWQGHKIRADLGIFTVINSVNATANPAVKDRDGLRTGLMTELGYEYGIVFSESYYVGVDATWTLFFPDSFKNQNITLQGGEPVSPLALALIPIVHFHFGYIFKDNTLLTVGVPYFWGLMSTIRHPISDSFFVEGKVLWFFDRILFNTGLHDLYFSGGLGLRF